MAYAASKGALLPLARSLASAWGKDNIQVGGVGGWGPSRAASSCAARLQHSGRKAAGGTAHADRTPAASPLSPAPQVNTLLPGAINTPFLDTMLANPKKLEYILGRIPLGAGRGGGRGWAGRRVVGRPGCGAPTASCDRACWHSQPG